MKARLNDLWRRLPQSGYRSPLLSYPALWAAGILLLCFYISLRPAGRWTPDSYGYMAASYLLAEGIPDIVRTPVYPAVILCLRTVFGEGGQVMAVMLAQMVAIVMSWHYLRRIAVRVIGTNSRRTVFWVTAVYVLLPSFNEFVFTMLTECFAITGTVFFAWFVVRDRIGAVRLPSVLMAGLWLALLIFLRPIFLCLIPLYVIWMVMMSVAGRRGALRPVLGALACLAVCLAAVLAYSAEMTRRYRIHSLTSVSSVNNYYTARSADVLRPEHTDDPALRQAIADARVGKHPRVGGNPAWGEIWCIRDTLNVPAYRLEEAVNRAIASDRPAVVRAVIMRTIFEACPQRMCYSGDVFPLYIFAPAYAPPIGLCLIFMTGLGIWMAVRRRASAAVWLLWLLSMAVISASLIGAMAEWSRLIAPGVPAVIILAGYTLSRFRRGAA